MFVLHIFKSLLTAFATESVLVTSTYPKTTFFDVSILMEQEIQTMSRRDFSEVVYLSRFVLFFSCSLLTYVLLCTTQQTYSNIFISPSSSKSFSDEDENGATRKQQHVTNSQRKATKCNVANILGMDGQVTPRSIAYAAVLVCLFIKLAPTKSSHC